MVYVSLTCSLLLVLLTNILIDWSGWSDRQLCCCRRRDSSSRQFVRPIRRLTLGLSLKGDVRECTYHPHLLLC